MHQTRKRNRRLGKAGLVCDCGIAGCRMRERNRRLGKAGLVLGIIGLVISLIPLWGAFVTIPCIAVGLPLSGVAFYRARKFGTPTGIPIAGWVTNAIALVPINMIFIVFMFTFSG